MGLFGSKKEGGLMDVIRCDEKDFLIWKWSPDGQPSHKENAIRYGSSLRVKAGEVAVFVYKQKSGQMQDYIVGPYDETIKTANFPILTGIVGSAFGGASPFQAEIYFINLSGVIRKPFFFDEFDLCDFRHPDFPVPAGVKGSITFKISDYKEFIDQYRLTDFDLDEFWDKIKDPMTETLKSVINQAAFQIRVPLIQIQGALSDISRLVEKMVAEKFTSTYKIHVEGINISTISLDKDSFGYASLWQATAQRDLTINQAETEAGARNVGDMQAINAGNLAESLRIQREETQRLQRLQTEGSNLTAHQINIQGDVAKTAAESLGTMGSGMNLGDGGGGGMNPAGMMTGMMMGGAVGSNMANMMGNMMQGMNQPQPPAPPAGAIAEWHISCNGQQAGPYTIDQLRQLMTNGTMNRMTYVWKAGMAGWEQAANVPAIAILFAAVPPPPPPAQTPPAPPAL